MKKILLSVVSAMVACCGFAQINELYLVGAYGWSLPNDAKAFTKSEAEEGVFSWTGKIEKDKDFKFLLQNNNYYPCLVYADADNSVDKVTKTYVEYGKTYRLMQVTDNKQPDNKFIMNLTGDYTITIRVTESDTSMVITRAGWERPTEDLISCASADGKGKRVMNIHSASGNADNPFGLLLDPSTIRGGGDKWCGKTESTGEWHWVILSLPDVYELSALGFRNGAVRGEKNIQACKVYVSTTGLAEEDWTLWFEESDLTAADTYYKKFDTPVEARYIKFMPQAQSDDQYVRIYGIDLYGIYLRAGNPEVVSQGKTIVDYSKCNGRTETPANMLDGNSVKPAEGVTAINPWAFYSKAEERQDEWCVIDLEQTYDISKFVLKEFTGDGENPFTGYRVYVADTYDGEATEWTKVAEPAFEDATVEHKEAVLSEKKQARYVKLEIPAACQTGWTRVREFEVYGEEPEDVTAVAGVQADALTFFPTRVVAGEAVQVQGNGTLRVFALDGRQAAIKQVNNRYSLSTADMPAGVYLLRLTDGQTTKQGKLVVE